MDAMTTSGTIEATPRRRRLPRPSRRTILASVVAITIAAGGALWITAAPSSQSTDDAYVAADATSVAPKVRGLVAAVLVRDNQSVCAGQPIIRIDPEEFAAKEAQARAAIADAAAGVASARAAIISLDAEQRLASSETVAARTAIRSADAQSSRAGADRRRFDALVASGAVARREADTYAAAAVTAEQDAARARALLSVSDATAGVTRAKRAGLEAALQTARARAAQADAALDLAQQDSRHATILAPIDGTVGNRQVRVGDYVQPGTRLLTLVPLHDLYVTANFKETQTAQIRPGQRVTIDADALPGTHLYGRVESLAPGSGASFALLPFEPGTGNFTKIVQRVGVRIRFDPNQPGAGLLRPGLSVTARVKLDR
ncbi:MULTISPECIES: HlyD family secretion protein [Sphingosinicellaceae]|uniref:HlyD family secretion protein n=1 Tax=Sphingosinicellaceae TaxID=2820280 RepID=UPI001C1DFC72|nr:MULTISPECIES: HlyD family secretion protein [Polymorphobacter]QYE33921.1 HlyD family secretion protein [Polymorphobacter sp. PAMC 29334]UAJ09090.1 HlyD family secretion protein [Polymorphobacter megasporae]